MASTTVRVGRAQHDSQTGPTGWLLLGWQPMSGTGELAAEAATSLTVSQHGGARRRGEVGTGRGAARRWEEWIWGVTGSRGSPVKALHGSGAWAEEHDGDGLDQRPMAPIDEP
jgi:hypothetical protein